MGHSGNFIGYLRVFFCDNRFIVQFFSHCKLCNFIDIWRELCEEVCSLPHFFSIGSFFASVWMLHDQFNIFIAVSDTILLAVILFHSLHGNRYWPLWFTAFHSFAVVSDILIIASPALFAPYDWALAGVWALPAVLSMSIGIVLDHRAGLKEN